jgi:hypothetical protein
MLSWLLFISLLSFGQAESKIELEKHFIDMGIVAVNESKTFELKVSNKGEGPLLISEVDPNCSCVKITDFPKELAPKSDGQIRGYVKSGSAGEVMKNFMLRSNASNGEQKVVVKARFE